MISIDNFQCICTLYGKEATPVDIFVEKSVSNKGAAPRIEELKKAK
jgi:hypothetical protein